MEEIILSSVAGEGFIRPFPKVSDFCIIDRLGDESGAVQGIELINHSKPVC